MIGNYLLVGLRSGNGRKVVKKIGVQHIVRISDTPSISSKTFTLL
jgi:hypothetical protein